MTNDNAHRRRRGAWLGLLLGLLLALGGIGYAVSSSPSASTGAGSEKSGPSTSSVLAPAANNASGGGTTNDNCVDPSSTNGNCAKTFGVTVGQVPLLYPTVTRSLPVTYSNPNSFDIDITTYQVSVTSSKPSTCPASTLLVPSGTTILNPRLTAPKNRSVTTTIPIRLGANAPAACQGVSFSITVNASAVKK